ncbi:MAG TPA: penicillin-binding protein 2 [Azospirillaceae bacterium]|nr:penicillin-binding protein 2 [Azospirillaceae bacterium]
MTDADFNLTGFDIAGIDRMQHARPEGRVRLQSRAAHALEQGRMRLLVTAAMFGLAFGTVGLRLVDVMVAGRGAEPGGGPVAATGKPQAGRGDIVDRNGVLLATSLATASLYADPKLVIDAEEAARKLAAVLPDLDYKTILASLRDDKRFVWIKRNLTPRQQFEINRLGLPGVYFQKEERRIYPQGNLAAHVVGFTGVDNNGLMGLEQSFDKHLKETGEPLQLSIDVRLQHILRKEIQATIEEFRAIGGAGIIQDAKTGEVLAMVSLPDFDPHVPGDMPDDTRFNRAALGVYEMGSTMKVLNTAMALESGHVRMQDSFDATKPIRIGRFAISDYHPENRWMTVPEIFRESSNIGSVRMAQQVGIQGQRDFMAKMGMLKPASIEIPEIGWPMVPNPWKEINLMTVSFGHGISVSPVQLVSAVSAIVNGGVMHQATLLKRPRGEEAPGTRVLNAQTSDQMRKLMRLVVTEGTAKQAFAEKASATTGEALSYMVGGKTGTAEKTQGRVYSRNARLSNFVGSFPINDPRYTIFIMIDEPKGTKKSFGYATAGWTAAPAARRVIDQIGPLLGVKPVNVASPDVQQALAIDGMRGTLASY